MDNKLDAYLSGKKLILVCICLLSSIGLLVFSVIKDLNNKSNLNIATEEAKPQLVSDVSKFYTVSGCVDKYLLYLAAKDSDKVYTILAPNYIKENDITTSNIFEIVPLLSDGQYTFNPRKMYSEEISKVIIKYYVFGYIVKQEFLDMNTLSFQQPVYFIVTLNTSELSFSIMPYNGKIFQ